MLGSASPRELERVEIVRSRVSENSLPRPREPGVRREGTVSALATGVIVFACVFGGALVGLVLRGLLPEPHLSTESKDVVKLGMGLLATMAALVLSLLIA